MSYLERAWPIKKRIWWCPNCNVPLIKSICCKCGSQGVELKLTPPSDARLELSRDRHTLMIAYKREFGTTKGLNKLYGSSILVLNKVPYLDEMREVVSDGVVIGRLYFDPYERNWRLRLSRPGVLRLIDEGVLTTYEVSSGTKIRRLKRIKCSRIFREGEQIIITTNGEPVGLGYYEKGYIKVHSKLPGPNIERISGRRSSIDDVIRANEDYMEEQISKSLAFLDVSLEKTGKKPILSFSGGKDSLVTLHLTLRLGLEPPLLFNDTGIEMPETIESVYKVADDYGLEVVEASAGNSFWKSVELFGPPARDYRWCCKILKLAPLARTIKSLWNGNVVNIVGQRAFESLDRARRPRLWRSQWIPTMLSVAPIHTWGQIEVWLYIYMNKLRVNPLYEMGYERIGCYMCPASTLAELELVKSTHPDLWSKWYEVLVKWARKLGVRSEWIDYGLWRWLAPAKHKQVMSARLKTHEIISKWDGVYSKWISHVIEYIGVSQNSFSVVMKNTIPIHGIEQQLPVIDGLKMRRQSELIVLEMKSKGMAYIFGNRIILSFSDEVSFEDCVDVLKLIARYMFCQKCKNCELSCPRNAIRVNEGIKVDSNRCVHCRLCLRTCPVAEVFIEHLVMAIVLKNPLAWRRESREDYSNVLEKIMKHFSVRAEIEEMRKAVMRRRFERVEESLRKFFELGQ